jgi:hypothetical protein
MEVEADHLGINAFDPAQYVLYNAEEARRRRH